MAASEMYDQSWAPLIGDLSGHRVDRLVVLVVAKPGRRTLMKHMNLRQTRPMRLLSARSPPPTTAARPRRVRVPPASPLLRIGSTSPSSSGNESVSGDATPMAKTLPS